MRIRLLMPGVAWLLTVVPASLNAQTAAPPLAVWVRGSDIETPEHRLTLALRDALEAVAASLPPEQAVQAQSVIYLAEDVIPSRDQRSFRYSASMADRDFRLILTTRGRCGVAEVTRCAERIYRRLIQAVARR